MSSIQLEPGQVDLLRSVAAGRVARHRLRRGESPILGADYEEVPGHGPGGLRKATARLKPLKKLSLVVLNRTGPATAASWPWRTTELGDTVLDILETQRPPKAEELETAGLRTQLAASAARVAELDGTLNAVLRTFVQPPGPGQEALRASYVEKEAVDAWRAVLYQAETQEDR